ncbi:MAG: LuxR family transcriptional regulator [Hyphomonadaceae bacterium]|nr:MAG: autoinducer-binding domain-containing protein [Caulobacteraceae bacterium]MBT9444870.1 LuxR family transcriptional regulator [Hyphomonadaceae bacterium]TPW02468.1 MAG: autoinducer-binding domain-containing protein [Alphaproteobacteria bacterium]
MRTEEVERFAALSNSIISYTDLEAYLNEVTSRLGFTYFALTHYVSDPLAANVANITNIPEGLKQLSIAKRYVKISPLPALCRSRVAGFSWSQALAMTHPTAEQREIEWDYRAFGVGEGFIVPANLVDDICGSVQFGVRVGEDLPTHMFPYAQYLGALAYDATRRIAKANVFPSDAPPGLTSRQLDCITLVARGKGDWEIGRLLEISKETVHKHIQAAMKRYEVTTRTQLVVRALYRSQISFDDVLR